MSQKVSAQQKVGVFSKYRVLILLVMAFFGLVILLSTLTFIASNRIAKATKELELSAEQTVLVQQLSKNLFDTNLYLDVALQQKAMIPVQPVDNASPTATMQGVQPQAVSNNEQILIADLPQTAIFQLEEIGKQYEKFDQTLQAFKSGGTIKRDDGSELVINASLNPQQIKTLERIQSIWTPYQGLLQNFLEDNKKGVLDKNTTQYLMDYTRLYNLSLSNETAEYTGYLNANIQHQASQLRMAQIVGMLVAFFIFIAIVFGALRQLLKSDEALAIAQQQTDDIMKTVNEGLFLIDKDLVISEQYSGKLPFIIHQDQIAGRNLYDLLKGMISQKDMETTKLFVEQLYNTWVVEDLIQDLNPLKQVLISYIDKNGMADTKFLEFNFLRVLDKEKKEIEKVFVSVIDVTKEVRLQMQMQKDKEQHDRQLEMISYLLTVNRTQLINFIAETKQRIARMNDILRQEDNHNLQDKVKQLYRETHSLKGDASAIKLPAIVSIVETQETQLKQLGEYSNLKGNDFLSFTISLNELMEMTKFIEDLSVQLNIQTVDKLTNMVAGKSSNHQVENNDDADNEQTIMVISPDEINQTTSSTENYWHDYFTNYAKDIAQRQHKKVKVNVVGFENLPMSDTQTYLYKDIATQFLKNAIVHGIESPEERIANGKDEHGTVILSLEKVDDEHQKIAIHDDGRGIDWQKIREKAVELGQVTQEQAEELQPRDLVRFLLSSGLSTKEEQDEDAGRGVGMDIVRQLTVEGKGKLSINSQPNLFTQMNVTFPK